MSSDEALKGRVAELEALVADLQAEKAEADQQAAARRAERMRERAAAEVEDGHPPPATTAAHPTVDATGPLAGVKVVECTHFIAGPLSGRLLADQGVRFAPVWALPCPRLRPHCAGSSCCCSLLVGQYQ